MRPSLQRAASTGSTGSYTLTLTAAGSGITDAEGSALANNASTSFVENIPAVVTNTLDDGAGSLRQALRDVAAAPGLTHTIEFSLRRARRRSYCLRRCPP
jgi:hypothetical protein